MRFRIVTGGPAARFVFDRAPAAAPPTPEHHIPTAAELDNPYGRYYGKTRIREDLVKNRHTKKYSD